MVRNLAAKYFTIEEQKVESFFSSLGGIGQNGSGAAGREARVDARELILVLKPKTAKRKNPQNGTRAAASNGRCHKARTRQT
jgi:hypothetical protein